MQTCLQTRIRVSLLGRTLLRLTLTQVGYVVVVVVVWQAQKLIYRVLALCSSLGCLGRRDIYITVYITAPVDWG